MGIDQQIAALQEQVGKLRDATKIMVPGSSEMSIGQIAEGLKSPATALEDIPWNTLSEVSKDQTFSADLLRDYVGQTKKVEISGYGTFDFICVGVRHDEKSDGSGKAGFTFVCQEIIYLKNFPGPNNVGWGNSAMRTEFNNLKNSFETEASNAICEVKKTYKTAYNNTGTPTSNDYVWAITDNELYGSKYWNEYGPDGEQYDYFSDDSSHVKKERKFNGTNTRWYTRQPGASSGTWVYVDTNGTWSHGSTGSFGVVPCFCV